MPRGDIPILINRLKELYGDKFRPFVTDEESVYFSIADMLAATFSVICDATTPVGRFNFQIEGTDLSIEIPDLDYLYMGETDLAGLLELIEAYRGPMDDWPSNEHESG